MNSIKAFPNTDEYTYKNWNVNKTFQANSDNYLKTCSGGHDLTSLDKAGIQWILATVLTHTVVQTITIEGETI